MNSKEKRTWEAQVIPLNRLPVYAEPRCRYSQPMETSKVALDPMLPPFPIDSDTDYNWLTHNCAAFVTY